MSATAAKALAAAPDEITSPSDAAAVLPPQPPAGDRLAPSNEAQPAAPANNTLMINLIALGALFVLVLAILAVLYRRFARRDRAARPQSTRPTTTESRTIEGPAAVPTPLMQSTAPVAPAMSAEIRAVTGEPELSQNAPTPIRRANVVPARAPGALPSAGAAVDLPARMPEDYEERSALLKRMIEAKPDKANPFRNRKSRLKRARLILQSLGRKFEHNDPRIDLSQYPNNWPELARRYSQAA